MPAFWIFLGLLLLFQVSLMNIGEQIHQKRQQEIANVEHVCECKDKRDVHPRAVIRKMQLSSSVALFAKKYPDEKFPFFPTKIENTEARQFASLVKELGVPSRWNGNTAIWEK